jgi:hypothetical protein
LPQLQKKLASSSAYKARGLQSIAKLNNTRKRSLSVTDSESFVQKKKIKVHVSETRRKLSASETPSAAKSPRNKMPIFKAFYETSQAVKFSNPAKIPKLNTRLATNQLDMTASMITKTKIFTAEEEAKARVSIVRELERKCQAEEKEKQREEKAKRKVEDEKKAREQAEKKKEEMAAFLKKEEADRLERKKRVKTIMARTRKNGAAGTLKVVNFL